MKKRRVKKRKARVRRKKREKTKNNKCLSLECVLLCEFRTNVVHTSVYIKIDRYPMLE
jgi:hypothetical protein